MPGETGGQAFCQVRHVGKSTLPGERVVVPGYTVGQAPILTRCRAVSTPWGACVTHDKAVSTPGGVSDSLQGCINSWE